MGSSRHRRLRTDRTCSTLRCCAQAARIAQIVVDALDLRGREGILRVHLRNKPVADDVQITTLARGTPRVVGGDLANLVNEGALGAVAAAWP